MLDIEEDVIANKNKKVKNLSRRSMNLWVLEILMGRLLLQVEVMVNDFLSFL